MISPINRLSLVALFAFSTAGLASTANSGSTNQNVVATFTQGYTLETYSGSWGTITRDPEMETYPPGQTVALTATPARPPRTIHNVTRLRNIAAAGFLEGSDRQQAICCPLPYLRRVPPTNIPP